MAVEVHDTYTQYEKIASVFDYLTYRALTDLYLGQENGEWYRALKGELLDLRTKGIYPGEAYFKFLGVVALFCAQYGFPSLDQQYSIHQKYGNRLEVSHPRHQLALLCRTADKNIRAAEFKKRIANRARKFNDPNLELAAWGLFIKTRDGVFLNTYINVTDDTLEHALMARINNSSRFIALPDLDTSRKLVKLNFSASDAEVMERKPFYDVVVPNVEKLLGKHVPNLTDAFSWRDKTRH